MTSILESFPEEYVVIGQSWAEHLPTKKDFAKIMNRATETGNVLNLPEGHIFFQYCILKVHYMQMIL